MRKKVMICGLVALTVIAILVAIVSLLSPLRESEEKIKNSILEITPIGTSMEEVVTLVENHKDWVVRWIDYEGGYCVPYPPYPSYAILDPVEDEFYVGEKSIRALMGTYRNIYFIEVDVTIFWGFDENSKLIDVYVWKDGNVL